MLGFAVVQRGGEERVWRENLSFHALFLFWFAKGNKRGILVYNTMSEPRILACSCVVHLFGSGVISSYKVTNWPIP